MADKPSKTRSACDGNSPDFLRIHGCFLDTEYMTILHAIREFHVSAHDTSVRVRLSARSDLANHLIFGGLLYEFSVAASEPCVD